MSDVAGDGIDLDWAGVSDQMARQILHQGETFMRAQLDVAIAADQRAVTAASIFIAIATATVGGAFVLWTQENDAAILAGGIAAAGALSIAALLCFWSARPILFYFPGNHPDCWWPCRTADLTTAIGGETENYRDRIKHNAECLATNGRILMHGMYIAVTAPVQAVLVWGVISYLL